MNATVGLYPCAAQWGISPHHKAVHVCHLKVRIDAAGEGHVIHPHDGDHVCRCGDRRAPERVPKP